TGTDSLGNDGTPATRNYTLDTQAPAAPGVAGPSGPSKNRTPSVTLTGEAGGTYACTLTGPSTNVAVTCGSGAPSVDLTGRADGTYTLTVTQTDAAGNTSPAGIWTYLLDTTAPAAPGVSGPAGPAKNRTPSVTLTGEAGASYTCTLTGPGTNVTVTCAAG